jgi:hypothetical protein
MRFGNKWHVPWRASILCGDQRSIHLILDGLDHRHFNLLVGTWKLLMARCEQGYLCDVCGQEVAEIVDSDLYLRYVLREVPAERLHLERERHIRCNPTLAQFIVDGEFTPVSCAGPFDKRWLDAADVADQESRVTRGWRRLQALPRLGIPITEYPL